MIHTVAAMPTKVVDRFCRYGFHHSSAVAEIHAVATARPVKSRVVQLKALVKYRHSKDRPAARDERAFLSDSMVPILVRRLSAKILVWSLSARIIHELMFRLLRLAEAIWVVWLVLEALVKLCGEV